MNKRIKIISIVLLSLLVVGLVSARIVDYFGRVEAKINATEPIVLEQSVFNFESGRSINDGENHYLLIKGENILNIEVPTKIVITIKKDGTVLTDTTGIHIAIDTGGDMHYCYEQVEPWSTTIDVANCDTQYEQWLIDNQALVRWAGTDATYESSGFVSPVNGNDWFDGSGFFNEGVLTFPIDVDPGIIASLIVVRADPGLELGEYTIEVEFQPIIIEV